MQLGMIGLGRMGSAMVKRLVRQGHECVAFGRQPSAVAALIADCGNGATGAASIGELVAKMARPRAIWMMVPASAVNDVLRELLDHIEPNDIVIDGGNTYYRDDLQRAEGLTASGHHYVDVGTSGGVAGIGDIRMLSLFAKDGIEGVITGRALYDGRLDLATALAVAAAA